MSAWVVTSTARRDDGRVEVTYSLAPAVRYVTVLDPGTDIARAIQVTGDHLAQIYKRQGYL